MPGSPARLLVTYKAEGIANKQAEKYLGTYSQEIPTAPDYFNVEERKYFDRIVCNMAEIGVASVTFLDSIITCAELSVQERLLQVSVKKLKSFYYTSNRDLPRAHPDVLQLFRVQTELRLLRAELGLTPIAHSKIGVRRSNRIHKKPDSKVQTGDWSDV